MISSTLALLGVAVLWGTYAPALKYLLSSSPSSSSSSLGPYLINFLQASISGFLLILVTRLSALHSRFHQLHHKDKSDGEVGERNDEPHCSAAARPHDSTEQMMMIHCTQCSRRCVITSSFRHQRYIGLPGSAAGIEGPLKHGSSPLQVISSSEYCEKSITKGNKDKMQGGSNRCLHEGKGCAELSLYGSQHCTSLADRRTEVLHSSLVSSPQAELVPSKYDAKHDSAPIQNALPNPEPVSCSAYGAPTWLGNSLVLSIHPEVVTEASQIPSSLLEPVETILKPNHRSGRSATTSPAKTVQSDYDSSPDKIQKSVVGSIGDTVRRWIKSPPRGLFAAGAELALFNVLAVTLCSQGLEATSASKAAILTQSASLFTPLLMAVAGKAVGLRTWAACAAGLIGSTTIMLDSSNGLGSASVQSTYDSSSTFTAATDLKSAMNTLSGFSVDPPHAPSSVTSEGMPFMSLMTSSETGGGWSGWDLSELLTEVIGSSEVTGSLLVLLSSVFYSLATFRISLVAPSVKPLDLACVSCCTQALLLFVILLASEDWMVGSTLNVLCALLWRREAGGPSQMLCILWLGAGPGALAAILQAFGQRWVSPASAQVIYNTSPLWSVLLASVLLGESMGIAGWAGGAVVLSSTYLAL
ncbi:hypothetical protein CEUSTIGMA_g9251.t1 [Chlamydomonas eustigma]|uniref:EamA domain-containing protein n=1 Tax=Chlamydomonas eustigma TaxID=1157962 RepID=A0A250XFJ2_9CHLO|nr:hypothetical protein CEUSTIGMA_g9251.t1 [Chlamydomonas eustigma]|eukprot:GAX81823.1 hypothetical protein CEUSTIGMA_g9251.t1 [Chlamydomonas eustigma]